MCDATALEALSAPSVRLDWELADPDVATGEAAPALAVSVDLRNLTGPDFSS